MTYTYGPDSVAANKKFSAGSETISKTSVAGSPLSAGVNVQDSNTGTPGRELRMNGVGAGGVGITVDGTDATANPEIRGLGTYGGQTQIDVMSVEAVAEVQNPEEKA